MKSLYAKEFLKFKLEFDRNYKKRRFREIRMPEMKKGLVSVVLPVYNGERYLKDAVLSVKAQQYENWELLIVDDGSRDRSADIARSYAESDGRIRLLIREHKRLPAALNAGFAAAKGEFYTWTSADNLMAADCLKRQVECLFRHRDVDMTYGNMRLLDENGRVLRGRGWYEIPPLSGNVCLPKNTWELNTYANNTIGAAFLYRASIAAVVGDYREEWFTMEDYDYFMRINEAGKIAHLSTKKPVYFYRMHGDSLTAKDDELGITARRPKLMAMDEERRKQLIRPICYDVRGVDRHHVMKCIDKSDDAATVCGVAFDTDELPDGKVKVYIADRCRQLPKGFDMYLSFSEDSGCPWSDDPEVLASFLDVYCRINCVKQENTAGI